MRQFQKTHPAVTFAQCTACKSEPRHIETHGRTSRETMQKDVPAIRHSLECRCGRATGLHPTLEAANNDWGQRFGQMSLALPPARASVRTINHRRSRNQEYAHV
jgi:hypothetical protein